MDRYELLEHCLRRLALFAGAGTATRANLPRIEEIIHMIQWALYGDALQPEAEPGDTVETLEVKNRLLLGRALAAEAALAAHTGAPGNSRAIRDGDDEPSR